MVIYQRKSYITWRGSNPCRTPQKIRRKNEAQVVEFDYPNMDNQKVIGRLKNSITMSSS